MKFIVTIDTEEDNWARYSATVNPVENIERIVPLQAVFDEFGARPTYLVSYPVANNPRSASILRGILEKGNCEIGAHCHPWNTPPFDAEAQVQARETMLCNLPEDVHLAKITALHESIVRGFGVEPVSFRAGRYGFGQAVSRSLCRLGYRVDSSVTPFTDWEWCQGPDFRNFGPEPFRFGSDGLSRREAHGELLEIPISIGYLQPDFSLCQRVTGILERRPMTGLRIKGLLFRLGLLNKVWLNPEVYTSDSMISLVRRLECNGYPCLNFTFHSTSLLGGLSPFVKRGEEINFLKRIRNFLEHARSSGWSSQTLSEYERSEWPRRTEVKAL